MSFIVMVSGAIVALLLGRAIYVVRQERGTNVRGSEPGTGSHTIHADYSSGFSGHSTTYRIPKDPQDYAKRFVPPSKATRK
ncbi:MAG: hypothetical protein AAF092_04130 [Pseudomonadota bacterium]